MSFLYQTPWEKGESAENPIFCSFPPCQARFVGKWRNGAAARWAGPSFGHVIPILPNSPKQDTCKCLVAVVQWTKGGRPAFLSCLFSSSLPEFAGLDKAASYPCKTLISLPEGSELSLWATLIQRCFMRHRVKKGCSAFNLSVEITEDNLLYRSL